MDSTVQWLFVGVFGCMAGLFGLFIAHMVTCRKTSSDLAALLAMMDERGKHMQLEIGTHETGLRGSVHKLRSDISPFVIWAQHKMEREG